jgi:radical SAM superfamily enzyme YgiQ (UPF0313 family)
VNAIDLDLEYTDSHHSIDFFLEHAINQVAHTHPDVICISCKAAQFPFTALFTRKYQEAYPDSKIIIGGWMPTLAPDSVLQMTPCDAVIRGEGERSLPELLHVINDDAWTVNGVSYREKQHNQIVHNPNAQRLSQKELDALPFPDYTILPDLHRYQPTKVKTSFSVQASRGCVNHQCIFCWNSTTNCDTSWRARSPHRVVEEIRFLVDTYGAEVIFFADDCFGADYNWLLTFTQLMKSEFQPGELEYIASMRVDSVPVSLLPDLFASGIRTIFHGIESGSPRCWKTLQKNLHPTITRQYILELIEKEIQNRISPICSFIVAFPEETEDDLDQTLSFCEELALRGTIFSLQILAPNEGTSLYYTPKHRKQLMPFDIYTEFGESENINPEQRQVLGTQLHEFMTALPDFRLITPTIPMNVLKQKYEHLGQIASYDGIIQRRFKVFQLGREEHKKSSQSASNVFETVVKKLKKRFTSRL